MNLFANKLRKSLVIRLKRSSLVKDSMNLLASSLLVNTVGLPIWKESWRLKLLEMLPCLLIWSPRRLWKSILITPSFKNLRLSLIRIKLIRLLRISFGYSSKPLSWPLVSLLMRPTPSPTESTEWSSLVSPSSRMTTRKMTISHPSKRALMLLLTTKWKKLIEHCSHLLLIK